MRIGMFSNAYRPVISGVVRSINLYRQGLMAAGHFVGLFAPEGRNYEDAEPFIFRYPALPIPAGMDWALPVVVAPQITWLLPRLKLDIIHSHHPLIVGSEALNFSRSLGIPMVFTFHTVYHEYGAYLGFEAEIVKEMVRRMVGDYVRKADRVIVPSSYVRDLLPSYHIMVEPDILPTPIDLDRFPPRARPPLSNPDHIQLLYVGRLAREKNLGFLLRAFALAHRQDPRLHLRLVGDGPDMDRLQKLAAELDVAAVVDFAGPCPFERVPVEMGQADLFAFTSVTETQGLVVLEAMAAGLPVVLVECQSLFDCVRPGIDCVVSPRQEEAFAAALLSLARDPQRAQALARVARDRAEAFAVPALTERLLDIYHLTIAAHRGRQP
ncbi:MAG: glycosyltransferase [Caldilineales bacterium]|nr:glycosyltransferase [Caldilineales bacterium]